MTLKLSCQIGIRSTDAKQLFVAALSAAVLLSPADPVRTAPKATAATRTPGQPQVAPSSSISIDDALVIRAVVEHTILPAVRRSGGGVVARIEDQSNQLCTGRPSRDTTCRIPDNWQQFLVPNPRGWPGLIENDLQRKELVASLEERNTLGHPLPKIDHPQVVLIPVDRRAEARQQNRSWLSLPGYTTGGRRALMYGTYTCGSLCGYGWLFVLDKTDGSWRVQNAVVTVIS